MTKQKYIILDRDGVINKDSSSFVKDQYEFIPIPRSLDAMRILSDNNFNIIVISNQSGIDRGLISPSNFIDINIKMINLIEKSGGTIQAVLYCPEGPMSNDVNRKPNPGMFLDIAERMNINLASKVTGYNIDAYGAKQYQRLQDDQNTRLADIDGISVKLSKSLSDNNILTVNDLMEVDEESLVEISGFSSKDIENIFSIVQAFIEREILEEVNDDLDDNVNTEQHKEEEE